MVSSLEWERIRAQFPQLWPRFLTQVVIDGLRGWTGQSVQFNYPLVAVVGGNGAGKTTLLSAAACSYRPEQPGELGFNPADFFPDTPWDRVAGTRIETTIKEGDRVLVGSVRKPTERWRGLADRRQRSVFSLDATRATRLSGLVGYAKIAKRKVAEVASDRLTDEGLATISFTLGRTYDGARFASASVAPGKTVGVLARDFGEYSQFHQGAGEASTLDLVHSIEAMPDYSLLLIDEIEGSLHPLAQRRLVQALLAITRRKRLQVIITTHSPYVLEEIPPEGRVLILVTDLGREILYQPSVDFALSQIDDELHPELDIFVEDRRSKILTRELVAAAVPECVARIRILPCGPANEVKMLGRLAATRRLGRNAVAVLDADEDLDGNCLRLPGTQAPERQVFEDLRNRDWREIPARFGMPPASVIDALEEAITDPNHHTWCNHVGDRLNLGSDSVWETLAREWSRTCAGADDLNTLAAGIRDRLP